MIKGIFGVLSRAQAETIHSVNLKKYRVTQRNFKYILPTKIEYLLRLYTSETFLLRNLQFFDHRVRRKSFFITWKSTSERATKVIELFCERFSSKTREKHSNDANYLLVYSLNNTGTQPSLKCDKSLCEFLR